MRPYSLAFLHLLDLKTCGYQMNITFSNTLHPVHLTDIIVHVTFFSKIDNCGKLDDAYEHSSESLSIMSALRALAKLAGRRTDELSRVN